uniref:Uncharacterized protein n=1 Tax=Amphimedon queenslandica TaxID=400682 RepID=A0A1X7SN10_AMPQE
RMYKIKDEVPAATAKALIVPFNILATLIAYGRLLDTGKFVKKTFGVAAGYFAGDNITDAMTLDTEEDIDLT